MTGHPTDTTRLGAPIATIRVPPGMTAAEFLDLMDSDYDQALELSHKATETALTQMVAESTNHLNQEA